MNWESVHYIDPYLGEIEKKAPFTGVEQEMRFRKKKKQSKKRLNYLKSLRTVQEPSTVIVIFGGRDPYDTEMVDVTVGANVYKFDHERNTWLEYGAMPERRSYHGAAYSRGHIYITGGNNPDLDVCERLQATKSTFQLNLLTKRWRRMTDMKFARSFHSVAVIDCSIFVFGGRDDKGSVLATAEKYNPESDLWTVMRPMPEPRMGMGCTICDGLVWLIGGMSYPEDKDGSLPVLDTVTCYDPVKNSYFCRPKLNEPRAFCGSATVLGEVYVLSGLTRSPGKGSRKLSSVPSVDVYNDETRKWERHHIVETAKHSFAIAKAGYKIFLFGGLTCEEVEEVQSTLSATDVFDALNEKTVLLSDVPKALCGAAAVTVPADAFVQKEPGVKLDEKQKATAASIIQSWFRGFGARSKLKTEEDKQESGGEVTTKEGRLEGKGEEEGGRTRRFSSVFRFWKKLSEEKAEDKGKSKQPGSVSEDKRLVNVPEVKIQEVSENAGEEEEVDESVPEEEKRPERKTSRLGSALMFWSRKSSKKEVVEERVEKGEVKSLQEEKPQESVPEVNEQDNIPEVEKQESVPELEDQENVPEIQRQESVESLQEEEKHEEVEEGDA